MLRWFRAFLPKEERFFDLFARHAQTVVQGALALQDMLRGGDETPVFCQRINQCGDGFLGGSEQCDDGNATAGDGCRANCTRELCGDAATLSIIANTFCIAVDGGNVKSDSDFSARPRNTCSCALSRRVSSALRTVTTSSGSCSGFVR